MTFNLQGAKGVLEFLAGWRSRKRQSRCDHSEIEISKDPSGIRVVLTLFAVDLANSHCRKCGLIASNLWWSDYEDFALRRAARIASEVTGVPWSRRS